MHVSHWCSGVDLFGWLAVGHEALSESITLVCEYLSRLLWTTASEVSRSVAVVLNFVARYMLAQNMISMGSITVQCGCSNGTAFWLLSLTVDLDLSLRTLLSESGTGVLECTTTVWHAALVFGSRCCFCLSLCYHLGRFPNGGTSTSRDGSDGCKRQAKWRTCHDAIIDDIGTSSDWIQRG